MRRSTGRAAAVGTAAFVLAGTATLAAPGVAMAETRTVPCGGTVTAAPGDRIQGVTLLGQTLDLGVVTEGIGSLLGGVCQVTVNVVDTAVAPVPGVGQPAASAVNGAVEGVTGTANDAVGAVTGALPGFGGTDPAPQQPPRQPAPQSPGTRPAGGSGTTPERQGGIPAPNSPVLGGSALPGAAWLGYSTGWAPMRDYTGLPMATPGLFSMSPGVRYGGQIPGYSPQFGILGEDSGHAAGGDDGVRNAGEADALPAGSGGIGDAPALPMLLAVLALSGVTAALVRTWVLSRATT